MSEINDFNQKIIDEFRANGGKVGGMFERTDLLLLHTTGARSGERRIAPLAYSGDGDQVVVAASKAGAPTNPDWYHNLVAHQRVTIELGSEQYDANARVASGEERERLWEQHKRKFPPVAEYEEKTERVIPVIVLERV